MALGSLLAMASTAASSTLEEGESQLLALLNRGRDSPLKSDPLLSSMAGRQARINARRHGVGEEDDRGLGLTTRCLQAGLIEEGSRGVAVSEFYFRTVHAFGGSQAFDPMVEEARRQRYEFVGIRCVEGDDGLFYWCVTLCRADRAREFVDGWSPGQGTIPGPGPGWSRRRSAVPGRFA